MFRQLRIAARVGLLVMAFGWAAGARGTYSIVACDAKTRECGVAVQTNNLAVGASVPYAQAGVGAVASQLETNPHYGPRGLELLAQGIGPAEVMKKILAEDGNFDGEGIEARQVGMVSVDGRAANYTGEEAVRAEWAGARSGVGYSIQGNGLVGANVIEAMERTYLNTEGTLAEKLMAALAAGDAAGGQRTGRESAALLVRTMDGFPLDIDLRVDDSTDPVRELRKLFDMQSGRQLVIDANVAARRGDFDRARALLVVGVARASRWGRVWMRAARVAEDIEEPALALQYINLAFSQNSAWVDVEIGEGKYAELGANAQFHRWVSSDKEKGAVAAYERLRSAKEVSMEERLTVGRRLLEVGRAGEATSILRGMPGAEEPTELRLLRATAFAAAGDYANATAQCEAALKREPNNLRALLRMAELKREMSEGPAIK
ncbi:MAG: DUF1028 domain-containing protein [Candidatus Acidiferrum sp.]